MTPAFERMRQRLLCSGARLDHPDLNVSWSNLWDTDSCPARKLERRPPFCESLPARLPPPTFKLAPQLLSSSK